MSEARKIQEAAKRFEEFTGHKASYVEEVESSESETLLKFGKLDYFLIEKSNGHTETVNFQNFGQKRPDLAASYDGKRLFVVGNIKLNTAKIDLGKIFAVGYTTKRDGEIERYVHTFRTKSRPTLKYDNAHQEIKIIGGDYQFKDTGINDR